MSFNVPYRNHFRITNLPDAATLREVFARIEELLEGYAAAARRRPRRRAATWCPSSDFWREHSKHLICLGFQPI